MSAQIQEEEREEVAERLTFDPRSFESLNDNLFFRLLLVVELTDVLFISDTVFS